MRISEVTFYRAEDDRLYVIKRQPKTLTENEFWCLQQLASTGYVPEVKRLEPELLMIEFIQIQSVTDPIRWRMHYAKVLKALETAGIRHGDLSEYSVIPRGNRPHLIDFAESRLWADPRPDKRPEGDAHWLEKTMNKYSRGAVNVTIHQRP